MTIIVPVLDEVRTLAPILDRVFALTFPKQVIVVDGGSRDGSREIVARLAHEGRILALFDPPAPGKGAAVRMAIPHAKGEVTVIQDADLEYCPEDLPRVVAPVLEGAVDVCYGSRIRGADRNWFSPFYWGGRFVSLVTSLLFLRWVTDEPTCYKAFRTEHLRRIPLRGNGFEMEPELTAKVLRWGLRYGEVPIRYAPRTAADGKKIRFQDGVIAVRVLLALRFRRIGPAPWSSR